ncbi:unnamed protein product [Echinostoma caproni]|uniref:Uncharacterized protein n=1 Tax=Echinostoma caproni TaxID=27848 RepID=A0A3P8GBS1_9TREM|nr:unnamed protein product [Echinostoma caproni]
MKKAHSTAYISLGPSQTEKIKVLGLVHGFISATDLRRPLRTSVSLKSSTHSQSNGVFRESSAAEPSNKPVPLANANPDTTQIALAAHCCRRFARDKSLRRSLPRVLVHPPIRLPVHETHSQTNLTDTGDERLNLDGEGNESDETARLNTSQPVHGNSRESGVTLPNLVPEAKYSVGSRHSTREVNFSQLDSDTKRRRRLTRVLTTPPIGRASLFNLTSSECVSPSVWMSTGGGTMTGSNPGKTENDSRASLDRANSGKRFLLMSQSGHVISCTTLFGEELEVDASSTGGVGCRRLQACPGWNFFPVFVEPDQFASDEELEKRTTSNNGTATSHSVHVSDAGLSFTNSDAEVSCAQTENWDRPITRTRDVNRSSGALHWLRRLFRRIRSSSTRRGLRNHIVVTETMISTSDVEAGPQESFILKPPVSI